MVGGPNQIVAPSGSAQLVSSHSTASTVQLNESADNQDVEESDQVIHQYLGAQVDAAWCRWSSLIVHVEVSVIARLITKMNH